VKYQALVDGQTVEIELDGDRVTLGGASHSVTLTSVPGTPLRQILIDGRPRTLSLEGLGRGRWALTVGGVRREVEVLDERTRHIRTLTGAGEHRRTAGALKAPMPGLVVRVPLEEGQAVEAGAPLVVLEAMKMENELKAPAAVRVTSVRVRAGEAVEKGQLLVEFETSD
jgi:acetyl/propionyl-CoA carboxylase alpha subunit